MALIKCPDCSRDVSDSAPSCIHCGRPMKGMGAFQSGYNPIAPPYQNPTGSSQSQSGGLTVLPTSHSLLVACFLGFMCPLGIGQMYNNQAEKGLLILVLALVGGFVTGGILTLILWPIALIDCFQIACRIIRGEPVTKWQWF